MSFEYEGNMSVCILVPFKMGGSLSDFVHKTGEFMFCFPSRVSISPITEFLHLSFALTAAIVFL
jgi:serine/threonine protein kinase